MENINTSKQKNEILITVAIVIATVISMCLRLFFGWDQDESYVVLLATKIARGCPLFKELWDLHQTSAIFTALFAKPYLDLFKDTDGIGIYLREISLILQLLVAIFAYVIIKKHYSKLSALISFVVVANMLPRATQQFEYGTITVWATLICSFILLDLYHDQDRAILKIVLAGVFYSISVLAYPTMLLSLPAYILFMAFVLKSDKHDKAKYIAVFLVICALLAVCFIGFVLKDMSISEFFRSLKAISNSGDHGSLFSSITNPDFWAKPLLRVIITIGAAIVVSLTVNRIFAVSLNPFFTYILLTTVVVMFLNITGIRPSGPYGFLERFIGTVILFWLIRQRADRAVTVLLVVVGVLMYTGSLMGSNLGLNENAMFLEVALVGCVIAGSEYLQNRKKNLEYRFELIAIMVFAFGVAFASGYFVRVNYTSPANFLQCNSIFADGPVKGIRVTQNQMDDMARRIEAIKFESEQGKIYAVLSNEPLYNFYINGATSAPRYVTTAMYNSQWITYYEEFDHALPDVIFVDTYWNPEIEMFYRFEFGNWVKERYHLEKTEYDDVFWKLVKNEE